jgi:hypothetical protein
LSGQIDDDRTSVSFGPTAAGLGEFIDHPATDVHTTQLTGAAAAAVSCAVEISSAVDGESGLGRIAVARAIEGVDRGYGPASTFLRGRGELEDDTGIGAVLAPGPAATP